MNSPVMQLASCHSPWLSLKEPGPGIVIATRVRLARNIEGYNFPEKADMDTRSELIDTVFDAFEKLPVGKGINKWEIDSLTEKEKKILVERKIITFESVFDFECGVAYDKKELFSVLINEEDHLHIQTMLPGLQGKKCWTTADKIETQLSKLLKFSFSNDIGYLTSSPINVGTGLKCSALIDLTCSYLSGQISGIVQAASISGYIIESENGDQEFKGSRFIVSNRQTLGLSEENIISDFESFIEELVGAEMLARRKILAEKPHRALNHTARAYNLLKNSWILSEEEAYMALMDIRTGVLLGLFENLNEKEIEELIIYTGDGHLQNNLGKDMSPEELDTARAEYFRKKLVS